MADDVKRSVVVLVYRDASKDELLNEIPIIDLGIVQGGQTQPTGAQGLINIAKLQMAGIGHDADALHYEVRV